jgi:hypothetical protein
MAKIESGLTADLLTIDPISKAARVTLYYADGTEMDIHPVSEYMAGGSILTTAAFAAGAGLFCLQNGPTGILKLKAIEMGVGFCGTAAATAMQLQLTRFNTASPTGGTAVVAASETSTMPATRAANIRICTAAAALTITGIVQTGAMMNFVIPRSVTGTRGDFDITRDIELQPNEGILLSYLAAGVIGDTFSISAYWYEM